MLCTPTSAKHNITLADWSISRPTSYCTRLHYRGPGAGWATVRQTRASGTGKSAKHIKVRARADMKQKVSCAPAGRLRAGSCEVICVIGAF